MIIAVDAAAAGNEIVNVPLVDTLSDPKSKTAIALSLLDELYINAPLAENVVLVKDISAKSQIAVVPEVVGSTLVRANPPVTYVPLEATSPAVARAVVVAPNVAVDDDFPPLPSAYNASLKVPPPEFLKLCVPSNNSFLKEVHIACVIAILESPYIFSRFLLTT